LERYTGGGHPLLWEGGAAGGKRDKSRKRKSFCEKPGAITRSFIRRSPSFPLSHEALLKGEKKKKLEEEG